ncbi:MAG: hypothetical protein JRG96_19990 [Deltaproteobacteria bacterium]|nr:hypothetical protein [Deltaproteobacteria bacterium]MBW2416944.1 hypothetical protein [Deltaproteobacteria bacterium]
MKIRRWGDGRIVMERIYRWTVGETFLECPDGALDPAGQLTAEPPAAAGVY